MKPFEKIVVGIAAGGFIGALYILWEKIKDLESQLKDKYHLPDMIILLRHGESEANVDPSLYGPGDGKHGGFGDPNIKLTELGKQQAAEAGKRLAALIGQRPVLCYVSPYQRTRQTADGVIGGLEKAGIRIIRRREDPRLREREFSGSFQHEDYCRDEEYRYSRFFWRPTSGESCSDVYDRVTTFLETLWRDFRSLPDLRGGAVLVVSHGLTARILAMRWLHWNPETFAGTRNPGNCD
eukprot:CAMPEP_0113673022 /NCGR_PEP_ID=MMETSP0038_2-20120614/6618_1 /TAXON_ID=2898 /ORGANISM="Cryptomonas paramecium" /LENGTH=237 /DNA_ID=CAMNT_0000589417 /DNA_START=6 /DNA_END=716 /DNA_ORIENTATION=- /assembly_acc=CAM_ASM_000170